MMNIISMMSTGNNMNTTDKHLTAEDASKLVGDKKCGYLHEASFEYLFRLEAEVRHWLKCIEHEINVRRARLDNHLCDKYPPW